MNGLNLRLYLGGCYSIHKIMSGVPSEQGKIMMVGLGGIVSTYIAGVVRGMLKKHSSEGKVRVPSFSLTQKLIW